MDRWITDKNNNTAHKIIDSNDNNVHRTYRLFAECGYWFADRVADYFPSPDHTVCADCEGK